MYLKTKTLNVIYIFTIYIPNTPTLHQRTTTYEYKTFPSQKTQEVRVIPLRSKGHNKQLPRKERTSFVSVVRALIERQSDLCYFSDNSAAINARTQEAYV